MGFEVRNALGQVRTRDVREALGERFRDGARVQVLVLDPAALAPVFASVEVVGVPAGRGIHDMLRCPQCGRGARSLRARAGSLRCSRCGPGLTARQRDGKTDWWRKLNGRKTDQLCRLLRPGACGAHRLVVAEELACDLIQHDAARAEDLFPDARAVLEDLQ